MVRFVLKILIPASIESIFFLKSKSEITECYLISKDLIGYVIIIMTGIYISLFLFLKILYERNTDDRKDLKYRK